MKKDVNEVNESLNETQKIISELRNTTTQMKKKINSTGDDISEVKYSN